jgi:hypothetical protein
MKIKLILVVVFSLLLYGLIYGQDRPPRDPNKKMPSAEEMAKKDLDSLKSELNLTEDQTPFIQKILLDSYTKMQKLFQTDPPDFSQMKTIMDDMDNDIKLVLTDEQIPKYTEYRERQRARFKPGNKHN